MTELKMDPRIIRTRKLLIDSFLEIAKRKELKSITIKDITDEATVNRATFYAHFMDKYELMDAAITETILKNIKESLNCTEVINEQAITRLFLMVTEYLKQAENECSLNSKSYSDVVEKRIKLELEEVFLKLLNQKYPQQEQKKLLASASFLAWGIYGVAVNWKKTSTESAEQYLQQVLPFLINQNDGFFILASRDKKDI